MDIPLLEPISHHLLEANKCKHQGRSDFVNCKLDKDAQRTLLYKSKQISKGQRPQISITKFMWFCVSSLWTLYSSGCACVRFPEPRMHQSEEGHGPKCWQPHGMENTQPKSQDWDSSSGINDPAISVLATTGVYQNKIIQRRHSLENKPGIYIRVQNSRQKCLSI